MERDDDPQDIRAFLRDLTELSQKYDLWISGCGECGSPWLEHKDGEGGREGPAYEVTPTDEYDGYQYYLPDEENRASLTGCHRSAWRI